MTVRERHVSARSGAQERAQRHRSSVTSGRAIACAESRAGPRNRHQAATRTPAETATATTPAGTRVLRSRVRAPITSGPATKPRPHASPAKTPTVSTVGRRAHDFTLWRLLRTATAPRHGPTHGYCLAGTNCPVRQGAAPKIRHRQHPRRKRPDTHDHRNRSRWARRSRYTTGMGTVRCGSRVDYHSLVDRTTSSNTQRRPVGTPRISPTRIAHATRSRSAPTRSVVCSRMFGSPWLRSAIARCRINSPIP